MRKVGIFFTKICFVTQLPDSAQARESLKEAEVRMGHPGPSWGSTPSWNKGKKRLHIENPTRGVRSRHTQSLHYHTQQLNQGANYGFLLLETTFLRLSWTHTRCMYHGSSPLLTLLPSFHPYFQCTLLYLWRIPCTGCFCCFILYPGSTPHIHTNTLPTPFV